MGRLKRGEVRWIDFPGAYRTRPGVILSRNSTLGLLNALTVAPVTTKLRDELRNHVYIDEDDGMMKPCNVTAHNLITLDKGAIRELITTLSDARMAEVENAIAYALGFGEVV